MNDVLLSPLRLSELELLIEKSVTRALNKANPSLATTPAPDEETPLTVVEASKFLGVSKQTVYQNITRIPHKKRFGRLYFFRSQLTEYLNAGEGATNE